MTPAHLLPTSIYTGPLSPGFLYADGLSFNDVDSRAQQCAALALSAAHRNRLVEGSKCQTQDFLASQVARDIFHNRGFRESGQLAPLAYSVAAPFS